MKSSNFKFLFQLLGNLILVFLAFLLISPLYLNAITYEDLKVIPLGPFDGNFYSSSGISLHPDNIIYVSDSNYLYLSLDGGKKFIPIRKHHKSFIWAADSKNPSRIYYYLPGANELYRSEDYGKTWKLIKVPSNPHSEFMFVVFRGIAISHSNPCVLYVWDSQPLSKDYIFYSQDCGNTWTHLNTSERPKLHHMDISKIYVDKVNPYKLYILGSLSASYGGKGYGLYIYTFDPKNPKKDVLAIGGEGLPTSSDIKLVQNEKKPDEIWAFIKKCVYKSTDGGKRFSLNIMDFCEEDITQIVVSGNKVAISSYNGLKYSNDGGESFSLVIGGCLKDLNTYDFNNFYYFKSEAPSSSVDYFATFKDFESIYGPRNIQNLSSDGIYATSNNRIYRIKDNENYFSFITLNTNIEKIESFKNNYLFVKHAYNTCRPISNSSVPLPSVNCIDFYIPDLNSDKIYACDSEKIKIFRINFSNLSYSLIKEIKQNAQKIAVSRDENKIIISDGKSIYISNDGGRNFFKTPVIDNKGINFIYIDDENPNVILVGGGSGLYVSLNGGQSFALKLSSSVSKIKKVSKNNYIIVSDKGIYESSDGGQTWKALILPYAYEIYDITKSDDSYYAATQCGVVKFMRP